MEINRLNVNEIVQKAQLKPDKDYGQNYLIEPTICQKIVDALAVNNDSVLEIGPGLGSLTHYLALTENKVTAVDIDRRMVDFLSIIYADEKNVSIVESDIRKHDLSTYTKIIGNLPYNITTETIAYCLLNAPLCKKMVFMCQSETLAHFIDISGKEYGSISVLIHLLGTCRHLFNVKAGSFYPAPKCSSSVFTIDLERKYDNEICFGTYDLAKKLFLNRRKNIVNNLLNVIRDKDAVDTLCNELKIDKNLRPEQLSPDIYLAIFRYLHK